MYIYIYVHILHVSLPRGDVQVGAAPLHGRDVLAGTALGSPHILVEKYINTNMLYIRLILILIYNTNTYTNISLSEKYTNTNMLY